MSKSVNELSLEQCLELDSTAVWYGSNATHGKPDVPIIYVNYPDHGGLYEYIGQAHIMKSDIDINTLYSLQDVREAIPAKISDRLRAITKNCLLNNLSKEEMSKSVNEEMSKYINKYPHGCMEGSKKWSVLLGPNRAMIHFDSLAHLHGDFTAVDPEPVFQIGDLVIRLDSHSGKVTGFKVIEKFQIKKRTKYRIKVLDGHKEMSTTPRQIRRMTAEEEQQYSIPKQHSHLALTDF